MKRNSIQIQMKMVQIDIHIHTYSVSACMADKFEAWLRSGVFGPAKRINKKITNNTVIFTVRGAL